MPTGTLQPSLRKQHLSQLFNQRPRLTLSALAVLFVVITPLSAQDCPECVAGSRSEDGTWLFKKEVNEVNVLFTARHRGKLIGDLTRDDISIEDNESQPAAITRFLTQQELPLRIALVVDTSGSIQSRFRFEQAAAIAFLRQVIRGPENLGFVMGFAQSPVVTQDFTSDPEQLSRGVASLSFGDTTALFDAVRFASQKLLNRSEPGPVARILVVLSDGKDNASRASLQEAINDALQSEVMIYTIGTNPQAPYGSFNSHKESDTILKSLAEQTGGQAMFPGSAKEVGQAFAKLRDELRCRYSVSYQPANFVPDGRFRRIKISARSRGKKLSVRARPGYFAELRTPALASNSY